MWIDLMTLMVIVGAALAGRNLGALRLAGSVIALPLTLTVSLTLYRPLATFIMGLSMWSVRTANMTAFALLITAGVLGIIAGTKVKHRMMRKYLLSPFDRLLGIALGVMSALTICTVLVMFISNLPGGRNAINVSLVWRYLNLMGIV